MDKIKLKILDISPSQVQQGSFTMILAETKGDIRLPIIIGMFEAQAIAIELENIQSTRPLTHDLFVTFAKSFDYTIDEVLISDVSEGIFYAQIICSDGIRQKNIDARPSDAIALALRFGAPIFANPKVLDEAGVNTTDLTDNSRPEKQTSSVKITVTKRKAKTLSELSIEELEKALAATLEEEEYEKAAEIRDELDRRS